MASKYKVSDLLTCAYKSVSDFESSLYLEFPDIKIFISHKLHKNIFFITHPDNYQKAYWSIKFK